MRPSSGGDALSSAKPRSRKSSVADPAINHTSSSHVPTSFFLRSEEQIEESLSGSQNTQSYEANSRHRENTFGVQSLADTLDAAFGNQGRVEEQKGERVGCTTNVEKGSSKSSTQTSPKLSGKSSGSPVSLTTRRRKQPSSNNTLSAASISSNAEFHTSFPSSAIPSTPKSVSLQSLKLSDEESGLDEIASQAITSSGEEEEDDTTQSNESGAFPQLVMPSIQMPKRRPFTTKGKAMGRIKILVAGESGVGKTSLIRSIVQLCEDIVHVDPLSASQSFSRQSPQSHTRKRVQDNNGTTRISEIHASTKSYPHWWTELEESRTVRRRKSTSDAVLERNICFIDTPGFYQSTPNSDDMNLVVEYIESLMYQNASLPSMEDSDLLGIIGGHGGLQVDVILYLLAPRDDISGDVQAMQRLSALTNVIPIIAKSDTITQPELVAIKTSILARLQNTSIRPFFFGKGVDEALLDVQGLSLTDPPESSNTSTGINPAGDSRFPFIIPTYPYAVSSTSGPDTENMDASLLMSPDYVQPLLSSELTTLVDQIFDPESISWLRHAAAKKFLAWRRRTQLPSDSFALQGSQPQRLQRSSILGSSVGLHGTALNASACSSVFTPVSPSGVLVPRATSPFYPSNLQSPFPVSSPSLSHTHPDGEGPSDFSLARYNSYAQGEQRFAEVRLAKWASDLQRSLRNERERYEELQQAERARWLLERVGEQVKEGNIVPSQGASPRADWAVVRSKNKNSQEVAGRYGSLVPLDARDPLGLCDFSDELRKRGLVLVKVLGGMSVLGAVMVTVVRACGLENQLPEGGLWAWLTGAGQ